MRCLGITRSRRRCQRDATKLFCREHRFQPVAWLISGLTMLGLFAGLYQDVIVPFLAPSGPAAEIVASEGSPGPFEPPSWYSDPPAASDPVYSVGTALSRNRTMALQGARTQALANLASRVSSAVEADTLALGEGVGSTIRTTTSSQLNGAHVVKQALRSEREGFRAYVLMAMPASR
jgi:hypothetical protein